MLSLRWGVWGAWVCAASHLACDAPEKLGGAQGESEGVATDDAKARATLLVEVPASVCDDAAVLAVSVSARRVGCERPPPSPCTLPATPTEIEGDAVSCPITEVEVTLGVDVDRPGSYQVETATRVQDGAPTLTCFAGSTLEREVLVTSVDLDVRAEKSLVSLGMPCPDPD